MFDQPPFLDGEPLALGTDGDEDRTAPTVGVVVPTRNRPDRLGRCLAALAAARKRIAYTAYICDSSAPENAAAVAEICDRHPFAVLVPHDRIGASAARNVGTEASSEELLIAVDDDVYVEPDAIEALRDAYIAGERPRVVAGAVEWSHWTSAAMVMRRIGFGRDVRPGEETEFMVSALLLYPRRLALELPWNERIWPYDDRYVTLMWRAAGAELAHAPGARARHDSQHSQYPVAHEADRIYVNLLDALLANPSASKALSYEFLSFAACAKGWGPSPSGLWGLVRAWGRGNRAFVRDYRLLRRAVERARALRRTGFEAGRDPLEAAAKST